VLVFALDAAQSQFAVADNDTANWRHDGYGSCSYRRSPDYRDTCQMVSR
jgi:hypothetical protein